MESVRRTMAGARVLAVRNGQRVERVDRLVTEEPMEIRVGGVGQDPVRVAVTMRTPGNDFELAAGFLFTEGLVSSDDIGKVSYCDDLDVEQAYNVVTVRLKRPFDEDILSRNFYATSSCGVCGKASLEQVEVHCEPVSFEGTLARSTLLGLADELRRSQPVFEVTGGLHAAGLFERDGTLAAAREDVGRHNAVDKLVGRALMRKELPLENRVLMVSGRASFEIAQKAAVAGIGILCAVSAPSSLAVDAADALGVTVVGFVRGESFNVYTHPERIDLDA
jgi:FdhD protein